MTCKWNISSVPNNFISYMSPLNNVSRIASMCCFLHWQSIEQDIHKPVKKKLSGKTVKHLKVTYRLIGDNTSTGCFPRTWNHINVLFKHPIIWMMKIKGCSVSSNILLIKLRFPLQRNNSTDAVSSWGRVLKYMIISYHILEYLGYHLGLVSLFLIIS